MENQNLTQVLEESFKNLLSSQNQKWHQQQEQLKYQQQAQIAYTGQIYIQDALGQVLQSANILPHLIKIENSKDLIPCGYRFGETPIYSYKWMKRSSDTISSTHLQIAKEKINSAIEIETHRLWIIFQNLNPDEKVQFVQQYPAFYYGFKVRDIKDAGIDVIISILSN